MTLPYFSPRANQQSTPLAIEQPIIPANGVVYFGLDAAPHTYSLWVNRIIPARLHADELAREVSQRKLPPQQPPVEGGGAPSFLFISRDSSHNRTGPLLAALGLRDHLSRDLLSATERQCSRCGTTVTLIRELRDLNSVASDLPHSRGELFIAPYSKSAPKSVFEELHTWATISGYRQEKLPASPANFGYPDAFLLDTFSESADSCHRALSQALPRMQRLSREIKLNTVLWLVTADTHFALSPLGACSTCGEIAVPLFSSPVTDAALRENRWSGRLLQGIPAEQYLVTPISLLQVRPNQKSLLAPYLRALSVVGFHNEHLLTECDSLSPSKVRLARAAVALTSCSQDSHKDTPLVMHEPFEGLADGDAQLLRGLLEHHGNTRSVVVFASPVLASSPASQSIPVWKTANSSDEDKAPHQNSSDDQRTPVIIAELPPLGANSTIGEWLGLTPLVIRRYAMSIGAKIAGISERDFKRRNGKRPNRYTCTECDGLGFILRAAKPLAGSPHYFSEQICKGCNGAAFLPPVSEVTFKERTLAEFQQQPIGTVLESIKSLPRVADGVAALELLSLTDLPLLLPLELVSPSERIRLMLVKALFDAPQPEVSSAPPKISNTSKGKIRAIIKAPIARGSLVEADLERISRLVAFSLTNGIQVRIGLDDSW